MADWQIKAHQPPPREPSREATLELKGGLRIGVNYDPAYVTESVRLMTYLSLPAWRERPNDFDAVLALTPAHILSVLSQAVSDLERIVETDSAAKPIDFPGEVDPAAAAEQKAQ